MVAAPLGSYLGSLIGWRNVFVLCILPSMLALPVAALGPAVHEAGEQRQPEYAVPRAASSGDDRRHAGDHPDFQRSFRLLYLPAPVPGNGGAGERGKTISLILLGFGLANFVGTSVAGICWHVICALTLALVPFAMGVLALTMVAFGHLAMLDGFLVALWGFAFVWFRWAGQPGLPLPFRMKPKVQAGCWWPQFSWR